MRSKEFEVHKLIVYAISGLIVGCMTFFHRDLQAFPLHTPQWTKVEQKFHAKSTRQQTYGSEYFAVVEVRNHYDLGKLTALRFIEWVQHNPNGVVAFTSGNTQEFFIKFLDFYKNNWHKPAVQEELRSFGIYLKKFPKTSDLKLVQVEEIYPLHEKNYKKISNYVVRHYAKLLQIKPENLLLMDIEKKGILSEKGMNIVFMNGKIDLSVTQRKANSQVELWQQRALRELKDFCRDYEKKIRDWGGIDFYVGAISYGGNLGFIQPGTKIDSVTHYIPLDFKTAAQGAKDMGGIDFSRDKLAITLGLGTITIKPNATILILAAGEAKAEAVKNAIENTRNPLYPATNVQHIKNSRFYITDGAAIGLDERQTEEQRWKSKHGWLQKHVEEVIILVALAEKKRILSLTHEDVNRHARGRLLLENPPKPFATMLQETHLSLVKKIEAGAKLSLKGNKIMHTSPHPEDIILGYYPLLDVFASKYKNHYTYFTSGYNSVSDSFILSTINRASDWWLDKEQDNILHKPYEKLLANFKAAYHKQDMEQLYMHDTIMTMKHLVKIFDIKDIAELKHTIRWIKDEYFANKQSGDLDVAQLKMLKTLIRETEADRLAVLRNVPLRNITHLRSKFYSGREFMRTPRYDTDILPFIQVYNSVRPDIITVLDDPDSAPPITNYRVLQIVAQTLRSKEAVQNESIQIIGYRNIWFKYKLSEPNSANLLVPVSSQMLAAQTRAYNLCFNTQKNSVYPSPFFDGDFSALADTIQREQLADLKLLLGADYFARNSVPEIREAAGFIFLNQMNLNDFFRRATDLQQLIDLEEAYINSKK